MKYCSECSTSTFKGQDVLVAEKHFKMAEGQIPEDAYRILTITLELNSYRELKAEFLWIECIGRL